MNGHRNFLNCRKKASTKNMLALINHNQSKCSHPYFPFFWYILIIARRIKATQLAKTRRVRPVCKISGVLSIRLMRRTKDTTAIWMRSKDSALTNDVCWFSTACKKAGSKTQVATIISRLAPVPSPSLTRENMRRLDRMISTEQAIK